MLVQQRLGGLSVTLPVIGISGTAAGNTATVVINTVTAVLCSLPQSAAVR